MATEYTGNLERRSRLRKAIIISAAAILASLALAIPASAVINSPPTTTLPVVFPERDFVVAEGYPANTAMTIQVVRDGVVIGTAQGTTDATGFLEVNHPGGVCWQGSTPNILPEDEVRFLTGPGNGDAVTTANVTADAARIVGDTVVVNGTARSADGGRLPLSRIEQRIIQPEFREAPGSRIGRRDIRADTAGGRVDGDNGQDLGNGNLSYDGPASNNWTATYTGLNATERNLAVAGQTRVLSWMAFSGGERRGITIYEVGELGGPGFGGCPAASDYAITSAGRKAINVGNVSRSLVLSGVSQNATSVAVTLNDRNPNTRPLTATATPSPRNGAQTWKATIPSGRKVGVRGVFDLKDGLLTAGARYTLPGGTVGGVNLKILKDTNAPGTPKATPRAGTYRRSQSVALETGGRNKIYFTQSGGRPTTNSQVYRRQIRVTSTQTIKAIAVDAAGNKSPAKAFRYVIR